MTSVNITRYKPILTLFLLDHSVHCVLPIFFTTSAIIVTVSVVCLQNHTSRFVQLVECHCWLEKCGSRVALCSRPTKNSVFAGRSFLRICFLNIFCCVNSNCTWLVMSQHDATRHVRRVKPMPFGCVELVEQHGSTHWTRQAWLARHVQHDGRIRRDSQLSLLCNVYKVMIRKLFTNLFQYTFI